MKTYYIYEIVYCTYQVPNKMNVEQVYKFIAENGNWNESYGFTNKEMAFEQWEKSKLWSETELDHDYDGEEYFEDVIPSELLNEKVEIINFRNSSICQLKAYQNCYDKYNKEYDWMIFIDCDEYLFMEGFDNIKDFNEMKKNYIIVGILYLVVIILSILIINAIMLYITAPTQ